LQGECIGLASCRVFNFTGVADAEFGAVVTTQKQLDSLAGCTVIEGDLHVDCAHRSQTEVAATLPPTQSTVPTTRGWLDDTSCPIVDREVPCFTRVGDVFVQSHTMMRRDCCRDPPGLICQATLSYLAIRRGCLNSRGVEQVLPQHVTCKCYRPATTTTAPTVRPTPAPDPVTNFNSLATIRSVQGTLSVFNCPSIERLGFQNSTHVIGLANLASITGARNGYSVMLDNNARLNGSVPGNLAGLTQVAGGVFAVNNTRLCDAPRAWNAEWFVRNNAPAARCGCTDRRALNYETRRVPPAQIDDDSCDLNLCISNNITCPKINCKASTCIPETGECVYEFIDVAASNVSTLACNDTLAWTVDDTCVENVVNQTVECVGTDICLVDLANLCPEKACHDFVDCKQGVCNYTLHPPGSSCSDGRDYTFDDKCTATGICIGVDQPCYQPGLDANSALFGRVRELQIRAKGNDTVCQLNTSAASLRSPGSTITFGVFFPNASQVEKFDISIYGVDITRILTSRSDPGVFRPFESPTDAVGQFEAVLLPNNQWMFENCALECFQWSQLRVLTKTVADFSAEYVLTPERCGVPGRCNVPFASPCVRNVATDRVCAHFSNMSLCSTQADEYQLAVRHLSHVVRDEKIDADFLVAVPLRNLRPNMPVIEFFATNKSISAASSALPATPTVIVSSFDVRNFQRVMRGISDERGGIELSFVAPIDDRDDDKTVQMVELTPFAVTLGFRHEFVDPSNSSILRPSTLLTIQHVSLSSAQLTDNSSYAISGRIVLGAESEGTTVLELNNTADCPASDVEVCALDAETGATIGTCVRTDRNGIYTLTVIIGNSVVISPRATNRTFASSYPPALNEELRFVSQDLSGVDFRETTTMELIIEYGGGACLAFIGSAEFELLSATSNPRLIRYFLAHSLPIPCVFSMSEEFC
jgi:hypothetical protein